MTLERAIAALKIEDQNEYRNLPDNLSWRAEGAAGSLTRVLFSKLINPGGIKRIAEFGAGSGGSTFALAQFAKAIDADLDAVEIVGADGIWKHGIIPREHVIESDGIVYFNSLSEKGIRPYDLITAFMLGPDTSRATLFRQLANACVSALTPTGNLLVTSDDFTLRAAADICNGFEVKYNRVKGVFAPIMIIIPDTLLVPQSECWKIKPE